MQLSFGDKSLDLSRPHIMGILNVTPDSFADGGRYGDPECAVAHALQMLADGASIIDIGGESTRPGAKPVTVAEEIQRVLPVITAIRKQSDCLISIDTSQPEVMKLAIAAGVDMLNDVRALQVPGAVAVAAAAQLPVCITHMLQQPETMQIAPHYEDVVVDVREFLQARSAACLAAGIARDNIIIDPGFGFGKTLEHNATLLNHLNELTVLSYPLLVGLSRKAMIGHALGLAVEDRLYASIALAVMAVERGAKIIRCHDVKPTQEAIQMAHQVLLNTAATQQNVQQKVQQHEHKQKTERV